MTSDSTIVSLRQPEEIDDPLTAVLRCGARRLLAQAVEAEAEAFLATMRDMRLADRARAHRAARARAGAPGADRDRSRCGTPGQAARSGC